MFNGDWHLVLAAYNGGLGRVQRAMKTRGTEDFWELSETLAVPAEGNARVRAAHPRGDHRREEPGAVRIQHHCRRDADRVREGHGPARDRPSPRRRVDRTDDRRDPGAESRAAALDDAAGDAELRDQGARRDRRRSSRAAWRLHRPTELASLKWYTVRRGESIATIARKLSVSRTDLAEANKLSIRSPVRAGQELMIPRAPTGLLAASASAPAPDSVPSRAISASATVSPSRREPSAHADVSGQARRHALVDRAAVQHDRRQDQKLERLHGNHIAPGDG